MKLINELLRINLLCFLIIDEFMRNAGNLRHPNLYINTDWALTCNDRGVVLRVT